MIFVDTSFLIGSIARRDAHHEQAAALWEQVGDRRLATTNHVRGETWTNLNRRSGHRVAVRFLESLARSMRVEVVRVDRDTEDEALEWLRTHDEREYSFVDATSFAFMRQEGIREALAFDSDFTAAGFVELRP